MKKIFLVSIVLLGVIFAGCSGSNSTNEVSSEFQTYSIDEKAQGGMEIIDNIQNVTVVSKDDNVLKAEYRAGFVQGKLQNGYLTSTRDNLWDMMYLLDPSHTYPAQQPPSQAELDWAEGVLTENLDYTADYIQNQEDSVIKERLNRIMFRMLGIYHGATLTTPESLDFSGNWTPSSSYFNTDELQMGYETNSISWLDIYFINAYSDFGDIVAYEKGIDPKYRKTKCSAFVKKLEDDILITHNTWFGFLSQTMTMSLAVNDDFMTFNATYPGIVGSLSDFGYNNKGILFNETTHYATYSEPKKSALWMYIRGVAAEQFASSITEFFEYVSLEPSGTYMNGYMVIDAKTQEIGLVEMSYKHFVWYLPNGNGYTVTTKPEGGSTEYDTEMVTPTYFLGINYPASYQIREDLQSIDSRPARKRQFMAKIGNVTDIETAKELITYTDPENPLSIFGRWDPGYGDTPVPKTVPDGSIDAKAVSMKKALEAMGLQLVFNQNSTNKGIWMKYGTPYVNGLPFVWSKSQWSSQKLRNVPDRVDGDFNLMKTYID